MMNNHRVFDSLYSQSFGPKKKAYDWNSDTTNDEPPSTFKQPAFRAAYEEPEAETGHVDKYRNLLDSMQGDSPAMDAFYEHVQNAPNRNDYKPGIMSRIFAGIAGGSTGYLQGGKAGIDVARSITEAPYRRAQEDWQQQTQGLKAAADIEEHRDAKRSAYLSQLRLIDKDAADEEVKKQQAHNAETTALARQTEAATRQRLADLTAQRDAAVNTREQKKLDNEIAKTQNTLAIQTEQNRLRGKQIDAFKERTETLGKKQGASKVKVISPQAQRTAEIDSAQELLNDPTYSALKPFVNIMKDGVEIDNVGTKPNWLGYGGKQPDKILMDKFRKELERKKKKRINTVLESGNDDDIIDLDDEDQ